MRYFNFLILFTALFSGCKKNAFENFEAPIFRMLAAENISSEGATFKVEIKHRGNLSFDRTGFCWQPKGAKPGNTDHFGRFFLPTELNDGTAEVFLDRDLVQGLEYEVWFIAESGGNIYSSDQMEFESMGSIWNPWEKVELHPEFSGEIFKFVNSLLVEPYLFANVWNVSKEFVYNIETKTWDEWQFSELPPHWMYSRTAFHAGEYNGKRIIVRGKNIHAVNLQNFESESLYEDSIRICDCRVFFRNGDDIYFDKENQLHRFHLPTNEFFTEGILPFSQSGAFVSKSVLNGYIVVDYESAPDSPEFWKYDFEENTWSAKKPYPGPAHEFLWGTYMNGRIFYGMGKPDGLFKIYDGIWEYIPEKDEWVFMGWAPDSDIIEYQIEGRDMGFVFYLLSDLYTFDPDRFFEF